MVEKLICHTCSLLCVTNNHLTLQSSDDRVFLYSQFARTFLFLINYVTWISYIISLCFPTILFPSVSPSLSHSISACVRLQPAGAVRANTDQPFGPIPNPPACADRPSTNLLLISWRDEAIAPFLRIACDEWRLISTRSISALQWSHLCVWTNTNCELESLIRKPETLGGKKKNLARKNS